MRIRNNKGTVNDTHCVTLEGKYRPEPVEGEDNTLDMMFFLNRHMKNSWDINLYNFVSYVPIEQVKDSDQ